MSRLIDADRLIDNTDDRYSLGEIGRREHDDIVSALEYAPTVPQWIPCSEKLPTEDGEYITTVEDGEGMFVTSHDWRQDWKEWGFLSYYGESDDPAWRRVTNVVAWMSLPDPYGGKQE